MTVCHRGERRLGGARQLDLSLRRSIHQQPEDVRTAVVATHIQLPSRASDLVEVDLGVDDLVRSMEGLVPNFPSGSTMALSSGFTQPSSSGLSNDLNGRRSGTSLICTALPQPMT